MSKKMTRREFIQAFPSMGMAAAASWSLGTQFLSSCSHFERRLSGEKERYEKEVIILGGGIAGLSLAHYLRKEKIPFLLFEASYRLGGRIYSASWKTQNTSGFSELGAYQVASFHERTRALLKDYLVPTEEIPAPEKWNLMGRSVSASEELKKFLRWREQKEKKLFHHDITLEQRSSIWIRQAYSLWNRQSSKEFAERLSFFQAHNYDLWNSFFVSQFGVDMHHLSALYFLDLLVKGPQVTLWKNFSKTIRWKQSSNEWIEAMGQRLIGSIPGRFIHLESTCVGLQKDRDWFHLQIQSPQGMKKFTAKHVVVALPIWRWKSLPGLLDTLAMNDDWMDVAQESIIYGESGSKLVFESNPSVSSNEFLHSWDRHSLIQGSRAYLNPTTQLQDLDQFKKTILNSRIHFTSSVLGDRFVDEIEGALMSSWKLAKSFTKT